MDKYETFWRRFFAGLIDGLIFVPLGILSVIIDMSGNLPAIIIATIVNYSAYYVYTVYFHWQTGQTFGKRMMSIRVVDQSETRLLTFYQSFMRDSVYIVIETIGLIILIYALVALEPFALPTTSIEYWMDLLGTIWFVLEVLSMLTNARRRAVHDYLAGSVVLKEEFWNGPRRRPWKYTN